MKIKRMHHVQITVNWEDVAAAHQFYSDMLGLAEVAKPAALADRGGFWIAIGDQQLHIGVEPNVDRTAIKAHIAYEVDDLQYWRNKLEEIGLNILESVAIPGHNRFECRDPFGNRMEFIEVCS
jgi:catechol 2,3-dioxygenase-like lactoylglutathione lyase family enzyme